MRSHWLDPQAWRVALWAARARTKTRHLAYDRVDRFTLPPAPALGLIYTSVVERVLDVGTESTCLVRSCVKQRWFADQGEPWDLVIGTTPPSRGFKAHAWLDRPGEDGGEYVEVLRLSAPRARR